MRTNLKTRVVFRLFLIPAQHWFTQRDFFSINYHMNSYNAFHQFIFSLNLIIISLHFIFLSLSPLTTSLRIMGELGQHRSSQSSPIVQLWQNLDKFFGNFWNFFPSVNSVYWFIFRKKIPNSNIAKLKNKPP